MADSTLTPEIIFIIERYAEALNTLAAALSSLVSDELLTIPEARRVLARAGVLSIEATREQQA